MHIRYGFRLKFDVHQPTAILARLDVHPSRRNQILNESPLGFAGVEAPSPYVDIHGNLYRRLTAFPGTSVLELSGLIEDPGTYEPQLSDEPAWPVSDLPEDSRDC